MFSVLATVPASVPDLGLAAAVIIAASATALVALVMMVVALHRSQRLTVFRGVLSVSLALGVVGLGVGGVVALSPAPAQAAPEKAGVPAPASPEAEFGELQLPTLSD